MMNGSEKYPYKDEERESAKTNAPKQPNISDKEKVEVSQKTIDSDAEKALRELLKKSADDLLFKNLFTKRLERDIQKKMSDIFAKLDPKKIAEIYADPNLTLEERQKIKLLFDQYDAQERDKAKLQEIKRVIEETQIRLNNFKGQIIDQVNYQSKNLRSEQKNGEIYTSNTPEKNQEKETFSKEKEESQMSKIEKKNLDKILNGETLVEESFNKLEKALKKNFRKAIELSGVSTVNFLKKFFALAKSQIAIPDWKKEFDGKLTEKEVNKIQKGYLAYLEAKKGNPDLSRLGQVIGALEKGLLNEGKSLDIVIKENLNMPISKKERNLGLKKEKEAWKIKNRREMNYDPQKEGYIQKLVEKHGYSKSDATNAAEKRIEEQQNRDWKQYLKEQEKLGNQKSDLGKFRILVESIKDQSVNAKISALLTDTNFDGMRNRLDGKGTKRGQQIDIALTMAQNQGKNMDDIVKNIASYMKITTDLNKLSSESFYNWMSEDINNAKKVQSMLMDSPVDALDIMVYGVNALEKSLTKTTFYTSKQEVAALKRFLPGKDFNQKSVLSFKEWNTLNNNFHKTTNLDADQRRQLEQVISRMREAIKFSDEELKAIKDKIDTDPETKGLSSAAKENLMASLSGYLLAKMKEPGADVSVNGLSVGVNIPLSEVLKGLSLNFGIGITGEGKLLAGVNLVWNKQVLAWKGGNASLGVNAGTAIGCIPVYGFRAGIEQDINAKKVLGSIEPKGLKTFSAGANVTMIGNIPSYGASIGFEKNQLKGIEKQYNYIKDEIIPIIEKLLTKEADGGYPDIQKKLEAFFPQSKSDQIEKATENLKSILNMAQNLDPKQAAQLIGEWYAESWKNNALQGLPKGWKVTGVGMGLQVMAGFLPIGTLSATLTKYKNLSYEDSPESKARLQQKIEKGIGDQTKENIQKSDFETIQSQLKKSGILASEEEINMDDKGGLTFPVSLLQKSGLTLRVNKQIKQYLKFGNGKITVPAGVSYRFLEAARTNGVTAVLDIGYDENARDKQEVLASIKGFSDNPKDYEFVQKILALNNQLKKLGTDYFIKTDDGTILKNGEFVKDSEGNPIKRDKAHALKIDSKGIISLVGVDAGKTNDSIIKIDSPEGGTILSDIDKEVQTALGGLDATLKSLWTKKANAYRKIAGASRVFDQEPAAGESAAEVISGALDKKGYLLAAEELIKELEKNPKADSLVDALKIEEKNNSKRFENPQLAHQIIDQIKVIMAKMDDKLKDSKEKVKNLTKSREDQFKGKSVLKAFTGIDGVDYKNLADTLTDPLKTENKKNIIGFTAFYRKGVEATERGMGMTPYGNINVLDKTFDLSESSAEASKTWILNNLKKHPAQLSIISKSLGKIGNQSEKGINDEGYLTNTSLIKLLEKGEINLDNGRKISISKVKPVAYFLAECANQSIGLELGDLQVEQTTTVTLPAGKMTYNLSESSAKANIEKSDFAVGLAFGGAKKGKEERNPQPNDGEVITNPVNPNSPDTEISTGNSGNADSNTVNHDKNDVAIGTGSNDQE